MTNIIIKNKDTGEETEWEECKENYVKEGYLVIYKETGLQTYRKIQPKKIDVVDRIKTWIIMLDATDFKDTDADLVRNEMIKTLKAIAESDRIRGEND